MRTFCLTLVVCASAPAHAHFLLQAPECSRSQDSLGSPQKLGPCGDEGGTPTGKITAFQSGQTITIQLDETVFHPGHYRVALAVNDRSELPAEPPVTAGSTTPCGTVPVQSPPIFPVLADGVLDHTQPFSGPQTIQVQLPSDVTCDHCTLQVIEFMSNHGLNNPGGCFYHHCADLKIQSTPVTVDSPASGCDYGAGRGSVVAIALVLAALTLRRRRA
jgi:hypothetical protein